MPIGNQVMPHNPDYHVMKVYSDLEHAGHLGGSYNMDIEELYNAVKTGFERAKNEKDIPALPHSAYSNRNTKTQLMHSHGLPNN